MEKRGESESNNSDKASRVKLTPSKQVLQSSLDTPINQSVLDILGISPSPIENTGADSKGEKRKGSGNEDSTHSLIKPTAPDAHAYMRLSQGKLVYSTEAISLQNIQLKERVTELELQLKEAKKSPLDQPESSKSTSHFSGELDVLSEEQFNLLCNS